MEAVPSAIPYNFYFSKFPATQAKEKGATNCLDFPTKEVAINTFSQNTQTVTREPKVVPRTDQFNIDVCLVEYWVHLLYLPVGDVELLQKQEKFQALKEALSRTAREYYLFLQTGRMPMLYLPVGDIEFLHKQEEFQALKEALKRIAGEYYLLLQTGKMPIGVINEHPNVFNSFKLRIQKLENLLKLIVEKKMTTPFDDFSTLFAFCFKTYLMIPMSFYREDALLNDDSLPDISENLKGISDTFDLLSLHHFTEISEAEVVKKLLKKYEEKREGVKEPMEINKVQSTVNTCATQILTRQGE